MRHRHHRTLTAIFLVALASRAAADPITHLKSDSSCTTVKGNTVALPPGYFLDELTWAAKDAEYKRLQDAETRLGAENTSLKLSATEAPFKRWAVLAGVLVAGFAVGYVVGK